MKATVLGDRTPDRGARRGASEKILIALETFIGLAAVGGGASLMARPDGSLLRMSPSALSALRRNSPFPGFFLPGLALTVLVGGGMLSAALLLVQGRPYALEVAMVAGGALVIFEIVQLSAIGFNPQQPIYGGLGAVVLGMAARRWLAERRPRQHAPR